MPTVAELLKEHVVLDIECVDRLYLNGWIPALQHPGQLVSFLVKHRGKPIPSPVLLNRMTRDFVAEVEAFVGREGIPLVQFERKQRKDDVANGYRRKRPLRDQVIFVGVAQERQFAFKASKKGAGSFDYSRQPVFVKQYYFYLDDADFGPCFIKIGTYAPFPMRICLNGHEWAKRQLDKRGIGYESLDNGFLSCEKPEVLQRICDSLGARHSERFLQKWLKRLPLPLTRQDMAAGYRHDLSIWQMEFSKTQVFDRPLRGREFFESVIRENLDLGRPERVQLLFGRKISSRTPGRFATRVVTSGVAPCLHISYKHTDVKQYFKEGRAARTETTISDAGDFGVGKRLRHFEHLRTIARNVNRRVLEVERVSEDCVFSSDAVERLMQPTVCDDGQRAPGLRFGDPRVTALLGALCLFLHLPDGFRNAHLRARVAELMAVKPAQYPASRMTYDLRRLRLKGMIARKRGSSRYYLTPYGFRMALFMTRINARLFRPGLAALEPIEHTLLPHPLRDALDNVNHQIDYLLERSCLKCA